MVRSHLWRQCEIWVWFFTPTWKWICKSQKPACQSAYYHLHNISRIRKFLSQGATCTTTHAFITNQIDDCYSLMNGLPDKLIKKLQRVLNTAARLVFNLRKYNRITPALVALYCLPVYYLIEFKTLLIVFKGLHSKAPTYIQEMIVPPKKKLHKIQWRTCPEGCTVQAWYFQQARIRSVWASGMELLAIGN